MIKKHWKNIAGFILALIILGGCAGKIVQKEDPSSVEQEVREEVIYKRAIRGMRRLAIQNVVLTEDGYYRPANCYKWRYPQISDNLTVIPVNIHWEKRGWTPDPGYKWANPDDDKDLCVVKYNEDWFREWLNVYEIRIKKSK